MPKMTIEYLGQDVETVGDFTIEGVIVRIPEQRGQQEMFAVYRGDGLPEELFLLCGTKQEAKQFVSSQE